jgi:phage shock protein C
MSEQQHSPYEPQRVRQLTRIPGEGMVAGVCAGLARYAGIDVTLVRVLAVIALCVGFPAMLIGYAVAWAIMPRS